MKLKCISERLNYIVFNGEGQPRKIRVGETFTTKAKVMPRKWVGLAVEVEDGSAKQAVVNPAGSKTAEAAKASVAK